MATTVYGSTRWQAVRARALRRDGNRCTVARWLGGTCSSSAPLHVHHIVPLADGGAPFDVDNVATVCAAHHPRWEALRRAIVQGREEHRPRCPHYHRTREGRRQCEARMARARSVAVA